MTAGPDDPDRRLDALASLAEPVRRRLHRYVLDCRAPVTRDEVSAATGMSRSTVAYHLDKLAESGLLSVRFERRSGRGGPGAGRPAKLYGRPSTAVSVSLPVRDHELLARLLARGLSGIAEASGALREAARAYGAELAGDGLLDILGRVGFEPYLDDGVVRLRNCPFEPLANEHRDVVCGANLALLEGVLNGLGENADRAVLDPGPDRCCVAVRAA